jgi:CelD/BcsL family acetyltransferase involved in cellulose biosynthesis
VADALPVGLGKTFVPSDLTRGSMFTVARSRPAVAEELSLEPVHDLAAVRVEWSELANRSDNLFATWEWASVWWKHFGRGRRLLVALCRDRAGESVAILPLYLAFEHPVRVARFIGQSDGDELGPVCERGEVRVADALLRSADQPRRRWDVLLAEHLPGATGVARLLGGRTLGRWACPVVDIEATSWDEYLAGRSSNFRSQVRRKERKLVRDYGLRYRLADDPDRLDADMDTLLALHHARWRDGDSDAFVGARAAFHREFAALALGRGWLRLWIAEADGRAVAAWYGFRYAGAEWYYQFGRDPAWDRFSVGLVLLAHTLREAINDGMRQYRLLRGNDAYKSRFATSDPGVETVAVSRGLMGHFAVSVAAAALALPRPARGLVTSRLR